MIIGLGHYLTVGAILFTLGIFGIFLNRKNVIVILMSIELILLSVNINFVAFSSFLGDLVGQVFALLVLTVAAAETAIGLAILVIFFRNRGFHRGRRHQPDEGLTMYQAIVFLPLLGFVIAALISLAGAHARFPGARAADLAPGAHNDTHDTATHAHAATAGGHDHAPSEPPAQGSRMAEAVTTTFLFIAAALSWISFVQVGFFHQDVHVTLAPFIPVGDLKIDWALRIDTLTAVMLVVVTTVSSLVHLYSVGYMAEDPYRPRFFAYLSFFTFAMLMLVTADNLVQLFFGWEGVGLASYLLIGFWYHKPEANAAAIKAFVVNRVGDFGFALGIFAVYLMTGAIDLETIFAQAPSLTGKVMHFLSWDLDALTVICLLLFMGAMGKSAQFLLHTWLPDAMEGPTPVSALIHAATMVTAGVFMVARLSPLFELAPDGADFRGVYRRNDRAVRRHGWSRAKRHQADRGVFDLFAARLHVCRHGRRGLFGRHVSSVHARLLQGAAVSWFRLGHSSDASRAGHPHDGRTEGQDPVHLLDDGHRHFGADRISVHRGIFFQGRHHRGGVRQQEPDGVLCLPVHRRSARCSRRSIRGG